MSTLALVLVVGGGGAYAKSKLITGKQIAKHTITGNNIKPKSLVSSNFKQFPKGPTGAAGAAGPAGAQGMQGPAGPQGPAGTARANALVYYLRARVPEFYSTSNSGFPSTLFSPRVGIVCLGPPAGYTAGQTVFATPQQLGFASTFLPNDCGGGNNIEVGTYDINGNPVDLAFSIVLP